jgi:hypothetical protein
VTKVLTSLEPVKLKLLLNHIYSSVFDGGAIHVCARHGHVSTLKLLVQAGANIGAQNHRCHQTVLHLAASNGYADVMEYVLSLMNSPHGIRYRVDTSDGSFNNDILHCDIGDMWGSTPAQMAAAYFNHECLSLLLCHGATVAIRSRTYPSVIQQVGSCTEVKLYDTVKRALETYQKSICAVVQEYHEEKRVNLQEDSPLGCYMPEPVWALVLDFIFHEWDSRVRFSAYSERLIQSLRHKVFLSGW